MRRPHSGSRETSLLRTLSFATGAVRRPARDLLGRVQRGVPGGETTLHGVRHCAGVELLVWRHHASILGA
eukprot:7545051-Pyramimonas_sp.AAC.1